MYNEKTIAHLKDKLDRLKELNKSNYQYKTLNQYAAYVNGIIDELEIKTVFKVKLLSSGDSSALGTGPSNTEGEKLNELINKYSEIITEINPNHRKTLLSEFKTTSGTYKFINVGVLLACIGLSYTVGKDIGNNEGDSLLKQIREKEEIAERFRTRADSLENVIKVAPNPNKNSASSDEIPTDLSDISKITEADIVVKYQLVNKNISFKVDCNFNDPIPQGSVIEFHIEKNFKDNRYAFLAGGETHIVIAKTGIIAHEMVIDGDKIENGIYRIVVTLNKTKQFYKVIEVSNQSS